MNNYQSEIIAAFSSIDHIKLKLILYSHLPTSDTRQKCRSNSSKVFKYDGFINIEKLVRLCVGNDAVLIKFLRNERVLNGIRVLEYEKLKTIIVSSISIDQLTKILRNSFLVESINSIDLKKLEIICKDHNARSSISNMNFVIIDIIHRRINVEKLKILKDNPSMNFRELFRSQNMVEIIGLFNKEKFELLCQHYSMGIMQLANNRHTVHVIDSMSYENLTVMFTHYRMQKLIELFNDQTFVNAIHSIENEKIWILTEFHSETKLELLRDDYLAHVMRFIAVDKLSVLASTYKYDDLEKVLRMEYLINSIRFVHEKRVKILCDTCQGESFDLLENEKAINFICFIDFEKLEILPADSLRNILKNEKAMNWIKQVEMDMLKIIEKTDIVCIVEGYNEKMKRIMDFGMTLYEAGKIEKIDFHFIKEGIYGVMKNLFPEDIPTDQVLLPSEKDFAKLPSLKDLSMKIWIRKGQK